VKKKKMRNKMKMRKNMIKKRWPYSSRSSTSAQRKQDLTRELGKRSQCQRECATIATRMVISLFNVHMREKKKTTIRKRSLTKVIRKTKNILRRKLMIKLMSVKNKTQVMRVLNWKVMT
jgi:hypothetical protein